MTAVSPSAERVPPRPREEETVFAARRLFVRLLLLVAFAEVAAHLIVSRYAGWRPSLDPAFDALLVTVLCAPLLYRWLAAERARRLESERRSARSYNAQALLNDILSYSLTDAPLAAVLEHAMRKLIEIPWLPLSPKAGVFLSDDDGRTLRLAFHRGMEDVLPTCSRIQEGQCLCGLAAKTGETQFATRVDERHTIRYPGMRDHGHYAVPLKDKGRQLGVLVLYLAPGHVSGADEALFLESVGGVLAGIIRRKQAEQELEARTRELQRSNADLQSFAAAASHDLQSPLRKVGIYSERIAAHCGGALDPECRGALERVRSSALRMRALVSGLLGLAQVSPGGAPDAAEPVDLGAALVEALGNLEDQIEAVRPRIEVGALPTVRADPLQMTRLFQNLLSNALKFAKPGEPPRVTVDGRDVGGGFVEISIRDRGIGFDPRHAGRIFEPFERLHPGAQYEGNGLGLSLCARIVERCGGRITASGSPGEGATFTVSLRGGSYAPTA